LQFKNFPASGGWERSKSQHLQFGNLALCVYYRPHPVLGGILLPLAGFSGSKKRSGGAHRVQPRPFEGPSRKQGLLFSTLLRRFGDTPRIEILKNSLHTSSTVSSRLGIVFQGVPSVGGIIALERKFRAGSICKMRVGNTRWRSNLITRWPALVPAIAASRRSPKRRP
jgi:hypothetical protein